MFKNDYGKLKKYFLTFIKVSSFDLYPNNINVLITLTIGP